MFDIGNVIRQIAVFNRSAEYRVISREECNFEEFIKRAIDKHGKIVYLENTNNKRHTWTHARENEWDLISTQFTSYDPNQQPFNEDDI